MPETRELSDREFVERCLRDEYDNLPHGSRDRLVRLSGGKHYWRRDSMCIIAGLRLDNADLRAQLEAAPNHGDEQWCGIQNGVVECEKPYIAERILELEAVTIALTAKLETVVKENADLLLKLAWWQTKDQREKEAASEYIPRGLMETRLD